MKKILVVGEKTSQVKKFASVLCGSYQSHKQAKYVYTYTGTWNTGKQSIKFIFLPLAGHITTLETRKGYNWGECPPLKLVYDSNAIVVKNKQKYVRILRKQIKGKDELWLALDPDSEGDNIALEVVNILENQLKRSNIPIRRIWNSSLTKKEIYRAFLNPKPWNDNLALGVQGRRLIDAWLGFAGTREITRAARRVAKVKVLSVGRVQLPTLYLVVQADLAHEMYEIKDRWRLDAQFMTPNGEFYQGSHSDGYMEDKSAVLNLHDKLQSYEKATILSIDRSTSHKQPPIPHNTTAAVSLLTKVLKIKAKKALDIMVELYNRGLLSYPRTENKKFKKDFPHKNILSELLKKQDFVPFITQIQNTDQVRCNGPKKGEEEDHDPIHPTGELQELQYVDALHKKAWDILTRYYISLFLPDLIISKLAVITEIGEEQFTTDGRTVVQMGWREIQWWKKTKTKDLPVLQENLRVNIDNLEIILSKTKPPRRLTDSQLLLEMEKANIGTKSSRPDIIKKIEQRNYIRRAGQTVISTPWGRTLIASLAPIWPRVITPAFTSHVEMLMDQVAKGKQSYEKMIHSLRQQYIALHQDLLPKLGEYRKLLQELKLEDQSKQLKNTNTDRINELLEQVVGSG